MAHACTAASWVAWGYLVWWSYVGVGAVGEGEEAKEDEEEEDGHNMVMMVVASRLRSPPPPNHPPDSTPSHTTQGTR